MGLRRKIRMKETTEKSIWELFELFATEKRNYGCEEKTIINYEKSLNRFLNACMGEQDCLIANITKETIMGYIGALREDDIATASINHYLRDLRAFLNWCADNGYCDKIPVKMIKGQDTVKETYSEEELAILLRKPMVDDYCKWRSWVIINWILATGNRERTICNIQMKDLDFGHREIVLKATKNKKVQIIPMSLELKSVLIQYVRNFRSDAAEDEYLFCNVGGEKLTENALKISIRKYNKEHGVEKTSIHAFRHTFAKMWIRNGGDVFRLQKMLGHRTLDMTRNYVNMFSSDLKEGYETYSPLDKLSRKKGMKHSVQRAR